MLMALGLFVFDMGTMPFEEMSRREGWRFGVADRFGARPAVQYLGPGEDTIDLTGAIDPLIAGRYSSLDTIREMAGQGESWPLIDGTGRVFGDFAITGLDTTGKFFIDVGVPRKADFRLQLQRVA